jgi:isoquinoline 1-oxidoreductase subunit beta
MLITAAADRMKVAADTLYAEGGKVVHAPSGRSLRFGALAAAAARKPAPAKPRLKSPEEWQLIGKSLPRVDNPAKIDGSAIFGLDFTVPGMVVAAVRQSPVFGGKLTHTGDEAAVRRLPGVLAVVPIPNGVAVVADGYWKARRALDALDVSFDDGPAADVSSDGLATLYRDAMDGSSWVEVRPATAPPTGAAAGKKISVEYRSQFLAHATMEPMNCTARVDGTGCDVWAPTQGQEAAQLAVMQALGLPKDKVRIHRTLLGGGFGRRLLPDFVVQAVLVAKAVGKPVKVVWSREEDMRHDFYRPAVLHRLEATLAPDGSIAAMAHRLVSPSILQFAFPPAVTSTMDPSCLEGLAETRYAIPSWKVDFHLLKVPVPTSVMRTTGFGPNLFAVESFLDEIAHETRQDPLALRRRLLAADPRALAVLDKVAEVAGWRQPPPAGRHRGIAFAEAFATYIAHVVELSVDRDKQITIHRIVAAIDPGTVLDPDIAINSIEGGTAWGLSCAMTSEITFAHGRVVEGNWNDYEILRLPQMPPVETHLISSGARPLGGVGEVGPVTLIPALTNALFAATGERARSLPLRRLGYRLS